MAGRRIGSVTLMLALVLATGGCKKREGPVNEGSAAAPPVDVSADRALARKSWIIDVARDPAPLVALAGSGAGWARLFEGDAAAALSAFESELASAASESPSHVGAARAALELAEAHLALADLVAVATPDYIKVVLGRPDTSGMPELTAWTRFVLARHAQVTGADPAEHWKAIEGPVAATAWRQAAIGEGDATVVALLAGRAEGVDAEPPAGGTPAFTRRLKVSALVSAGRAVEARRLLGGLEAQQADVVVGDGERAVALRDPVAALAPARAYAALAAEALRDATGWALLYRARAELLAGRAADASATLEGLLKAPPDRATLAELVLSGSLGVEDLRAEALALRVRVLAESGQVDAARPLLAQIPIGTIGQRVARTWAGTFVGEKADAEAFPDDRGVLTRALGDELAALGQAAKGTADVAALGLVDRYADQVQIRFAEALSRGGNEALGVKMREEAEDKANAFSPSPRNRLPALACAARDNVGLGRPRVALKYLSRLAEKLPDVAGPSDMLRDLLTARAMDQAGSAAAGQ